MFEGEQIQVRKILGMGARNHNFILSIIFFGGGGGGGELGVGNNSSKQRQNGLKFDY